MAKVAKHLVGIPSLSQTEYEASLNPTDAQEVELTERIYELAAQVRQRVLKQEPTRRAAPTRVTTIKTIHAGQNGRRAGNSPR